MNPILSGSLDDPITSIHFMKNGDVLSDDINDCDLSQEDLNSLICTQAFIFHALERNDWIIDFLETFESVKDQKNKSKPTLTLIQGGLSDKNEN